MNNPSKISNFHLSHFENQILNQSNDKIIIVDFDNKLKYFNPAAQKFAYATRKIELKLEMVLTIDVEKELMKEVFDRVSKGERIDFKKSYVLNNKKHTLLINTYPIRNEKEEIIGLCCQAKNIETKDFSPKNILSNEKLFKTLFENSPIGITIRELETQELVACNDQIIKLFGCSREKFLQYNRKKFIHFENEVIIEENKKKLKRGEIKNYKLVKQYKKIDGTLFYGIATRSIFEVNNVIYQIGILENIDQQKKIEKKLINSEALLKAIFNSTSDKVFAIDKNYKLIHANEAALKSILHFISHNNAQKPKIEDMDLRKLEYFLPHFERAFAGEQYDFETGFYNIDDKEYADFITISPVKNTNGEIVGASFYGKEITEIKNYQKKLSKTTAQLKEAEKIARLGSWELDVTTKMMTWSDSVIQLYGLPAKAKTVHVKQFYRLVHPDDVKNMKAAIRKTIEEGVPYELKSRRINIDGKIIHALGKGIPQYENGKVVKIFVTIEDITKEAEIQATLQESEAKIRTIFNSTDDKIFAIDKEYRLIDFNASAEKHLPLLFEMEKLEIGNVMLAQKTSLRKLWKGHYDAALSGEKLILEKNYKENDVKKIDIVTISPIRDKNDEIIGAAIYGREITDLQKAKKEAKETQIQLKDAQELGKIGNWKYDASTQAITWSDSILKMFAYEVGDPLPSIQECIELVHPDDLNKMMEAIYNSIKQGVPYDQEIRMKIKSGKYIFTRGKGTPILDENNKIKLFEGTLQDITKIKKIEENIQSSNQKYRELFETVLDGIVITNHEGRMIDANPAAEKLLGYTKEELGQLIIKDIVHPDDQKESQKFLKLLMEQGYYTNYRGRTITKNGATRYIQVNSNAIYKNGKMVGSRDIVRDVSQLYEAEKKTTQLLEELAEVNKELSDFAHIVSHDLKAPLRAIKAISNWLSEDYSHKLDDQGKKQLALLGNRVHRMHEFIEGIFEYTKMGRIKESKVLVEMMEIIHNVILMINLDENVEIKILKKLPEVYCEKIKIEQVFQNLISNAIKYNDKKYCKIEIDYEDLDTHFLFKIKDNGKGIEKKNFEKIFQIFQTLQAKDDFESTGIGLSIVKRVVQLHGGTINVKSELGKSTTFEFTLEK